MILLLFFTILIFQISKFNEHTDIPIMTFFNGKFRFLQLYPPSVFSHSILLGHRSEERRVGKECVP